MASSAKRTETIRHRKMKRRGQETKNRRNNRGSTPTAETLFAVQPKDG